MLGAVGEDEAVEALFRRTYADLVRLAALVLGDRSQAEDVVQEAFAGLQRRAEPLAEPERIEGYLRRSVVNGSRSRLRRLRVERAPRAEPPRGQRSTEDHAVADEDARAVAAALRQLPLRQRECAVWHYQLGLSHAEVAAVLGISIGSVKTHLHRASQRLTTLLEDRR
jgi:RNA polymerase sigma-70 factor (sigma-E family)